MHTHTCTNVCGLHAVTYSLQVDACSYVLYVGINARGGWFDVYIQNLYEFTCFVVSACTGVWVIKTSKTLVMFVQLRTGVRGNNHK
jgi:hypothetical protein